MKRRIALALATVVVAASAVMGGSLPAKADVNPYVTEGTHHVNGRDWRTTCEPYSQTKRCRTEIKATQVSEVNGKFVARTGWVFNNLTYLPSPRALWKGNKLAFTNEWTASDGRRWNTECDTLVTGRNGCRSYTESRVIQSSQNNGTWTYTWVTKFVFNNIVMFTASTKPTPTTVVMPDAELRACINVGLRKAIGSPISLRVAEEITELNCADGRIHDLRGLEAFPNLTYADLSYNQISDLTPLKGLHNLEMLALFHNDLRDVKPLASLTGLTVLDLSDNQISDISPLKSMTGLEQLYISTNKVTDLTPLRSLKNLGALVATDNGLSTLGNLSGLTSLTYLDVSYNSLTDVKGVVALPQLEALTISGNEISDLAPLAGLTRLQGLDASSNGISNVSPLASLKALDMLFLDFNSVTDVAPLQGLTGLTVLGLWDNEVANVTPLAKLVNLQSLMLAYNNIVQVAPLATLPKLQELFLWGNSILDRDTLQPLLDRGCEVYFDEPDFMMMSGAAAAPNWSDALETMGVTSAF